MISPIRLFWWRGKPNFGDMIAPEIVRSVSGREVQWAPPEECELFAVGSLLSMAKHSRNPSNRAHKPWVWGTGNLGPIKPTFLRLVRIAALRGPLTKLFTLQSRCPTGDPGILLPIVLQDTIRSHDRIGVVAHHSKVDELDAHSLKGIEVIDPRTDRPMDVVRRIAECRFIFTSSLHGMIVADAFGVPNRLLDPAGIHRTPMFKFYDYALSVRRRLRRPVTVEQLVNAEAFVDLESCAAPDVLRCRARDLMNAFPPQLRHGFSGPLSK